MNFLDIGKARKTKFLQTFFVEVKYFKDPKMAC